MQRTTGGPEALRFERARTGATRGEWPGAVALAAGILLWIFFAAGVIRPVAGVLAAVDAARPVTAADARARPAPADRPIGHPGHEAGFRRGPSGSF